MRRCGIDGLRASLSDQHDLRDMRKNIDSRLCWHPATGAARAVAVRKK